MGREEDQFSFDLLIPGYRYCGPFNPEDNGEPINYTDECCRQHDLAYKKLGPSAYFYFNEADAILLDQIKDQTDIGAVIARNYFQTKRRWSSHSDKPFPAEQTWKMFRGKRSADESYEDKFGQTKRRGDKFVPVPTPDEQPVPVPRSATRINEPGSSFSRPIARARPTPTQVTPTNPPPVSVEVSPEGEVRRGRSMAPKQLDMDVDETNDGSATIETAAARTAGAAGSGGMKGSHETAVTPHAPQYGLKETATVVLPFQAQCTIIGPTDYEEMQSLKLRLNTPYDIIKTSVNVAASPSPFGMGVYANKYPRGWDGSIPTGTGTATWGTSFPATALAYPQPMANNEKPQWRQFWEKHYKVYAVMETEVIVRVKPLIKSDLNRQGLLGYGTDVSSTDGNRVNNLFPDRRKYREMIHWPGVSWKKINTQADGDFPEDTVLRFTWRPGNLNKPVTNDEDVKTWTNIPSQPTMEEVLVLWFGKSWENQSAQCEAYAVNVEYRQIVQFKDLNVNAYYPTGTTWSEAPSLNYTVNGDVLQAN